MVAHLYAVSSRGQSNVVYLSMPCTLIMVTDDLLCHDNTRRENLVMALVNRLNLYVLLNAASLLGCDAL